MKRRARMNSRNPLERLEAITRYWMNRCGGKP